MNRTQKFALNSVSSMISQMVVMVAGMITPRLMISTYGSEVNGLVSSLNQFISYIALVEAGIGGAAIYSLYKPLADNNRGQISSIVVAAKNSYRQAGYIFSSGILILAFVYAIICNTKTLTFSEIFPLALLLGVSGCFDFFFVAGKRVLLTADQRMYVISGVTILNTIVRTIIICVMAMYKANVILLYGCAAITAIIKTILIALYTKKNYPYIDNAASPDMSAMSKRWEVIYQQILGIIQSGAPIVLATVLLNLIMVSVYSVYNMVISGLNGVLGIFISGLPAGFGDLIARDERENLKKAVSEFEVAYYYILSIVYGLAFVLILPFVAVYTRGLTDANYMYPVLGFTIVLNGLIYNIKTPQSMLIISAGMYKETRWRVTMQGAIIIFFGAVFGKMYGLAGIMIGSCLSNLYRTIDLLHFTPKHITHASPRISALRMLRVVLNIALVMLLTVVIHIDVTSYMEWLLYALGYGICAIIIVTMTTWIFDRNDFIALTHRAFRMLGKRGRD